MGKAKEKIERLRLALSHMECDTAFVACIAQWRYPS